MSHPTELRYSRAERVLHVAFDDGATFDLPAELLRVESPSAEVQGHGADGKTLVSGRAHVNITAILPEGNYAVRLVFDDQHDTGIYSWTYLRELGERRSELWDAYLAALAAAGLGREP
ncbi:MAG: DUF971 domain-containing protein [Alphaproteobacteria bacterium]|nr:DUF971 domain-containing protein [Alphaproteobacteria bacterium]MCY4320166.1 DUF971 domain-containing protein [Alphaproteobacteria bacterium]